MFYNTKNSRDFQTVKFRKYPKELFFNSIDTVTWATCEYTQ